MTTHTDLRDAVDALITAAGWEQAADIINDMHPDAPPLGSPAQRAAHQDRQRMMQALRRLDRKEDSPPHDQ